MRKIILLLLIGLFIGPYCFAQREVMFDQYAQNPMAINPAFTGVRGDFNMTAILRRKWFTIPNSPSSQTFAADGVVANGKIGIGFQALNDQTGYFTTTGVYGSVAYHAAVSDRWTLSIGGQGGINVLPIFDTGFNCTNRALASFGLGAWLRSENLYFGISKPEILNQNFGNQLISSFYRRPLYISAGGSYDLGDELLLIPSILMVHEKDHNFRVDVGGKIWFNEKIGIGASYRMGGADKNINIPVNYFQFSGEVQVGKNIRLGYLYDTKQVERLYFNQSGPKGIHELMLKFIPSPIGFQKY
tara:strand:+ start:270 stop:1172 length:903 start_codon:yes stop_codon:yes gene_type:complete